MNNGNYKSIRRWMNDNASRFVDECGEVNCTAMVEAWDRECANGGETLDPHHIAWDVAVYVQWVMWKNC